MIEIPRAIALARLESIRLEEDETEFRNLSNTELESEYCLSGLFTQYHSTGNENNFRII